MDLSYLELKRVSSVNRAATEADHGDFLAIEDLLDFSNEDIGGSIENHESNNSGLSPVVLSCDELKPSPVSYCAERPKQQHCQAPSLFEGDVGGSGELCVPCDDLAELEWLSNFVEESFSSGDGAVLVGGVGFLQDEKAAQCTRGTGDSKQGLQRASPVSVLDQGRTGTNSTSTSSNDTRGLLRPDQIHMVRPGRARSKRCRTAVCFWNTRILSITDDCNILEASSTSKLSQQSSSSSDSETLAIGYDDSEDFFPVSTKKPCKASKGGSGVGKVLKGQVSADGGRRCLHCGSQRTPQWRAGPMGPKTLCNACGVRYKSGRLLPEYRPAASPTFVETIHSNSHRRVLEMRRQRDDAMFGGHVEEPALSTMGVC